MTHINRFILLFCLIIGSAYASYFPNSEQHSKDTDTIALLSANSVYQLDNSQLPNILRPFIDTHTHIKGIEIYENLENELLLSFYRYNDQYHFNKSIPHSIKNYSLVVKRDISHGGSVIGYMFVYYNDSINLNKKEKEYLKEKKVLKFCADPNWMPYEQIENGTYKGIGSDYIALFEKKLGIEFQLVPTKSWEESKINAQNRVCDILPFSSSSEERKKYMNVSKIYVQEPLVLATKNKEAFINDLKKLEGKTVAMVKGYSIVKRIEEKYPNIKIKQVNGILEALDLVDSGKVYGAIDAISIINYHIQRLYKQDLKISSKLDMKYELGMASNKDEPILNTILNKTINSITDDEAQRIYNKWNNKEIEIIQKVDYTLLYWILSAVALLFAFFLYRQYILKQANKNLQEVVELKTKDLSELNKSLEKKVNEQVNEIREKELILMEQAKLASMGMMIGNIAHQWRQPLSVISSCATSVMLYKDLGQLDDEHMYKSLNQINDSTQHLSETIETFRNFVQNDKELVNANLQETISLSLNIIEATLQNNSIELINNINECEPIQIALVKGELSEVIVNIINNAKDILKEKEIQNPWIKIDLEKKDDFVQLTIEDNGGGIPNEVMPKIFDPYFTTKHQSQGTGLGLHMSYRIITESLHGKLYAQNTQNGAKFYIELPLEKHSN